MSLREAMWTPPAGSSASDGITPRIAALLSTVVIVQLVLSQSQEPFSHSLGHSAPVQLVASERVPSGGDSPDGDPHAIAHVDNKARAVSFIHGVEDAIRRV